MENKEQLLQLNIRSMLFDLEALMQSYSKMSDGRIPSDATIKNNTRNVIKHYCHMVLDWTDCIYEFSSSEDINPLRINTDKK